MQYTRHGDLHRVVRITGPTHNLLGIEFGGTDSFACAVERLGPPTNASNQLGDEEVKVWVLRAVARANAEFGSDLVVRRIQYVADDTRDSNVYAILARELVQKAG